MKELKEQVAKSSECYMDFKKEITVKLERERSEKGREKEEKERVLKGIEVLKKDFEELKVG